MTDKTYPTSNSDDEYLEYCKRLLEKATPEQLWLMNRLISIHDSGIFTADEWNKFLDIIFAEQRKD